PAAYRPQRRGPRPTSRPPPRTCRRAPRWRGARAVGFATAGAPPPNSPRRGAPRARRSRGSAPLSRRCMLDQTIRQAILTLREAGHGTRAIAHALGISRGAVKAVLAAGTAA